MQLVVSAVANALDDSESILHKAVMTALRVGAVMPGTRLFVPRARAARAQLGAGDGAPTEPEEPLG